VQQTQADQLDLFRLQSQISTGRRIFKPSEDGPSALRSISLQRTLERKDQVQVNLQSAKASLTSAEGSLNNVGTVLNDIRAEALGVSNTINTEQERLTTRDNVFNTLDTLVNLANSTYQETFLFAGARSLTQPFVFNGRYVEYRGDEANQQRNVDVGILFDTNIPGSQVFGGLSEAVRGTSDLNPQLSGDTLLSDLKGGNGISSTGSLEIAYVASGSVTETESVVVDLSSARTIGDIARLIEVNGPPSADLRVSITGSGLSIEVEPGAGSPGGVLVREVAGGQTAAELGVLAESPATTIAGGDLDPRLRLTTGLDALLGTKSQGRLTLGGNNNDLVLTAAANGASFDNLQIDLVDGAALGGESALFVDGAPPTLTITIDSGSSSAEQIAQAINDEGTFTAAVDFRDAVTASEAGRGTVAASSFSNVTTGGSGESLDLASGLQITNGDEPFAIDTSQVETVEDLLNELNRPENGLSATLNTTGTGIDVRTRRSGADFSIGEGASGGQLATQLGIRTYTTETRLEDFNRRTGVILEPLEVTAEGLASGAGAIPNRFDIEITDGGVTTQHEIDVSEAQTVGDVIDAINSVLGPGVAQLATPGNGLTIRPSNAEILAPTPASGTVALAGDTLTFAAAPGAAGNQDFSLEIVDGGSGGLSATAADGVITVDLGGAASTTDAIAAAIEAQLPGFTVASDGTAAVAAPVAPQTFATTGGADASPAGADSITISGDAAQRFGFFAEDETSATSTTGEITSEDRHSQEVDSVFNSLLRLGDALLGGVDAVPEIGRSIDRLDDDLDRVTNARGEIGSRVVNLDSLQFRLEDEEVELRATLSRELDVDLTEAISNFTARQASLQASLQVTASLLQLSVLDFL